MSSKRPIRVLIAKPGLDGHDKGAKIVARALKDAGMEVIYTGIKQTVEAILRSAVQEGADVIGLSILSGTHLSICRELTDRMAKEGIADKMLVLGGIIPKRDIRQLKEMGVAGVFGPSATTSEIAQFIEREVHQRDRSLNGTSK